MTVNVLVNLIIPIKKEFNSIAATGSYMPDSVVPAYCWSDLVLGGTEIAIWARHGEREEQVGSLVHPG